MSSLCGNGHIPTVVPCLPMGVSFSTSGSKLAFYFRWGSQILGGLGLKNFLASDQHSFSYFLLLFLFTTFIFSKTVFALLVLENPFRTPLEEQCYTIRPVPGSQLEHSVPFNFPFSSFLLFFHRFDYIDFCVLIFSVHFIVQSLCSHGCPCTNFYTKV